ncbi:MAG: hypothetical protein ABIH11_05555 [Candidatus Altiarchaeota archaeon]
MKAQITVDFMIAIGVALTLFILILQTINSQDSQRRDIVHRVEAKNLAEELASAINSVYLSGEGSNRTIVLPHTMQGGVGYEVRVYPKSVLVRYDDNVRMQSTGTLTADIGPGEYVLVDPGRIMISYSGGVLKVENE